MLSQIKTRKHGGAGHKISKFKTDYRSPKKHDKLDNSKLSDSSLTSIDCKDMKDTKASGSPEIQKMPTHISSKFKHQDNQDISEFCLNSNHDKAAILKANKTLILPNQPKRSRFNCTRGMFSENIRKPEASVNQTINIENIKKLSGLQNTCSINTLFGKQDKLRRRGLFSKLYKSNTEIEIKSFHDFLKEYKNNKEDSSSNKNAKFLSRRYTNYDLNKIKTKLHTFSENDNAKYLDLKFSNKSRHERMNTKAHTYHSSETAGSLHSPSLSNYFASASRQQPLETPYASVSK